MDHVNTLLAKVLHRRGLAAEAGAAYATHRAGLWIAEHLKGVAPFLHVRSLKDGKLAVSADNSIAAQECSEARMQLLADLQKNCTTAGIREIVITRSA